MCFGDRVNNQYVAPGAIVILVLSLIISIAALIVAFVGISESTNTCGGLPSIGTSERSGLETLVGYMFGFGVVILALLVSICFSSCNRALQVPASTFLIGGFLLVLFAGQWLGQSTSTGLTCGNVYGRVAFWLVVVEIGLYLVLTVVQLPMGNVPTSKVQ